MKIRKRERQIAAQMISIILVFFLFNSACSQDEKPLPSPETHKIVKSISKVPVSTEAKAHQTDESLRSKSEGNGMAETKPVAVEEKEPERPKRATEEASPNEETGYYVVKKGDTLAGIAGKVDVYGDSLKWPILVRHNMDELTPILTAEDLPDRVLPDGMRLKIFTLDEVKDNLKKRGKREWAVNVLSSPNKNEVIPVVLRLIRFGFPVYITRANVKGTDYMRVRIGFFAEKAKAVAEGNKMRDALKLSGFWTPKAGENEVREFGGY